jgi:hypothetical protein
MLSPIRAGCDQPNPNSFSTWYAPQEAVSGAKINHPDVLGYGYSFLHEFFTVLTFWEKRTGLSCKGFQPRAHWTSWESLRIKRLENLRV